MRLIIGLMAILLGIAFVLPSSAKPIKSEQQIELSTTENVDTITHEEVVRLTDAFMDVLVQEVDRNYKVKRFDTKDSFMQAFMDISTEEVVKTYIDYYYLEEKDGLFIIPTETPPWFDKQNEYDVVQLDKNRVLVQQENSSKLFGNYGIDIEFTFVNQKWKITKITHR